LINRTKIIKLTNISYAIRIRSYRHLNKKNKKKSKSKTK